VVFEVQSTKDLAAIDSALHEAAARHKFGVLTVHDLQETMRKKGVDFGRECRIYEVCNPHQAKAVLEANPSISTALPCRISVYSSDGGYTLATIRPTALMQSFDAPDVAAVAREVEDVLTAMMNEAA
jgi:uncharacterized protein (DUF302 family)